MKDPGALLATVERSGFVESVHLGHAVLIDPDGSVVGTWGNPSDAFFPRSANKPLQAIGLLDAGLPLRGEQLAIATGSHSGEAFHLAAVRAILADGGLSEADLENTPALPVGHEALLEWVRAGGTDAAVTQNCSGKHAAMLRTAQVLGAPTRGYRDPDHVVQQAALSGIIAMSGENPVALGTDGCGAPVAAISLVGLARAFSRLVQAGPDTAAGRVAEAMSAHPEYVAGTGRDVTEFMRAGQGRRRVGLRVRAARRPRRSGEDQRRRRAGPGRGGGRSADAPGGGRQGAHRGRARPGHGGRPPGRGDPAQVLSRADLPSGELRDPAICGRIRRVYGRSAQFFAAASPCGRMPPCEDWCSGSTGRGSSSTVTWSERSTAPAWHCSWA
jgi:L-asparaginase II